MLFTSLCHCLLVHCRQYRGVLRCLLPYVIVYLSTVGSTEVSYVIYFLMSLFTCPL